MGQFYNISDPEEMSINGIPYGEISLFKGIYKETKSPERPDRSPTFPCALQNLVTARHFISADELHGVQHACTADEAVHTWFTHEYTLGRLYLASPGRLRGRIPRRD